MTQIQAVLGDITEQHVDVVVNAANSGLLGGGGVDGAIHAAGGPSILQECRRLRATALPHGLPPGQAVATGAGLLPATWVVHTVGPVYSGDEERAGVLASAYRESLRVAESLGAASVAFPAISAGAYGWPMRSAARIAVQAVHDYLTATPETALTEVRFVLVSPSALAAFEEEIRSIR